MKQHNLYWGSSYDRGLQYLLFIWSDIKTKYPDAELHVCYGWQTFDALTKNNPERQEWKKEVQTLMKQPGIIHHGRLGKKQLQKVRQQCGIWTYPTDFYEINCITALESQADGLVPVTMNFGALGETVGSGFLVEGDIKQKEVLDKYLSTLLEIMGDETKWKEESLKAQCFALKYRWNSQAKAWSDVFSIPKRQPLVTIITPTIRKGFWNVMAHNIAHQTYSNVEWLVVDGYKEDRFEVMKRHCKKHNIENWHYLREKKRNVQRNYSLVNANNTGWMNARGELLVWLQDFVLMPPDGIERLVDIYLHNPSALIAPVDVYYKAKKVPAIDREDWWSGTLDVVGDVLWKNIRNKKSGLTRSDNPFDFEMNYGAISKKVVEMLNGWWEFVDDGLGYDNTMIAYRAMMLGCPLIVDAENKAMCIDHWKPLEETEKEIGKERNRNLNDARYVFMKLMMENGKLPLVRDQKLDDSISLPFSVPKDLEDKEVVEWIKDNLQTIVEGWMKTYE